MLTADEQRRIRKAAQRLAAAAVRNERLRQAKAIALHHYAPQYVRERENFADLLKEIG